MSLFDYVVGGLFLIVVIWFFGTIAFTLYDHVAVVVPEHEAFCESFGFGFQGYANDNGSMINCVIIVGDKAIIKTYLVDAGAYYEVSR